jgi:hypothetical protein
VCGAQRSVVNGDLRFVGDENTDPSHAKEVRMATHNRPWMSFRLSDKGSALFWTSLIHFRTTTNV